MRRVVTALLGTSLLLLPGAFSPLQAESYPDKPVRFIVPFTPGGSTDLTARIIAEAMSSSLKQSFVIENRPGAAATIGIDLVAKSKPDGYTLGISGVGATAIIPLIDSKLSYDPSRDLDVVAGLSAVDAVVVARTDLKQNTMKEVLEFAKANPEKISYASAGVSGPVHLSIENLQQLAKVKLLHVPFTGDVPAITAVLTGDVSIGVVAVASATPFLKDGKLKALAAGGPGRLKLVPDVPSIAEQAGLPDYTAYAWNVLVTARGTPPDIIEKLNKAVNEAVARPDVKEKLENLGLKTLPGDVKRSQDFVAAEIAKNKRIIELTGLKRE